MTAHRSRDGFGPIAHRHALGVSALLCMTGNALAFNLEIGFSAVPDPTPVPLSPWAAAVLSALVALCAFFALRCRHSRWGTPLAVLLATGLLAAAVATTGVNVAYALAEVSTVNLVLPSPTISPEVVFQRDISIVNTTGQTIRIDRMEIGGLYFPTLPPSLTNPAQSPRCLPGSVLAADAVCYVKLGY